MPKGGQKLWTQTNTKRKYYLHVFSEDSSAAPIISPLTVQLHPSFPHWQFSCTHRFPIDSSAAPIISSLTVQLHPSFPHWQFSCTHHFPIDSSAAPILSPLAVQPVLFADGRGRHLLLDSNNYCHMLHYFVTGKKYQKRKRDCIHGNLLCWWDAIFCWSVIIYIPMFMSRYNQSTFIIAISGLI